MKALHSIFGDGNKTSPCRARVPKPCLHLSNGDMRVIKTLAAAPTRLKRALRQFFDGNATEGIQAARRA